MRKYLLLVFYSFIFFCLIIESSLAVQIAVTKNSTSKIEFGDILTVNIQIKNLETSSVDAKVQEFVVGADPIDPPSLISGTTPGGLIAAVPPFYQWNLTLTSNSEKIITYKIKPLSFGEYNIAPTRVTVAGETFLSNSLTVLIKCKTNGKCEPDKGENYFTCSEDCPSGSTDDVCDLIKDGRCDSDCTAGADPDCVTPATTTIPTTTTLPVGKTSNLFTYLVIILVIIAVAAFFFLKIKVVR